MRSGSIASRRGDLAVLDGLRGFAALWVLTGHAALLTGLNIPLVDRPDLAVDLFIALSGFLMTYHYGLGIGGETWSNPKAWIEFWMRRVFRIAPLYYLMMIIAIGIEPLLFQSRSTIDTIVPAASTSMARYSDATPYNWFIHLTFLFGLTHHYCYETPLPDWSIGLEMAFYGSFPALMLVFRKLGAMWGAVAIACAASIAWFAFHGFLSSFPMPSFLTLKLPIFMAGAVLAIGFTREKSRPLACALAMLLTAFPSEHLGGILPVAVRAMILLGFAGLIYWQSMPGLSFIARWLSSTPARFVGETSFGVYLIHLLVMEPIVARVDTFISSPMLRWATTTTLVIAVAYPIAYALFLLVEQPAHNLGKRLTLKVA